MIMNNIKEKKWRNKWRIVRIKKVIFLKLERMRNRTEDKEEKKKGKERDKEKIYFIRCREKEKKM